MSKVRTTLTIDEEVLRAVKVRAARTGRRESEIIKEAVRRDLGLELLERIWAKARMPEDHAFLAWFRSTADVVEDPRDAPPIRSRDPDDDHLIALAEQQHAVDLAGV